MHHQNGKEINNMKFSWGERKILSSVYKTERLVVFRTNDHVFIKKISL